ncbi:MAG: hypothetical protein PVF83_02855 [Anaerolineales bacterium]|jgi:hypothetical protein
MSYDIPSDPEEELPDWLKGMQSEETRADNERDEFIPEEGDEVPDWLETNPLRPEASSSQGKEVPDWLAGIRESESALSQGAQEISESEDEDGAEPEWLLNLRQQQVQEIGGLEQAEESDADSDVMSHIQSLQEEDENAPPSGDWVSGIESDSPSDEGTPWDFNFEEEGEGISDQVEGESDVSGGMAGDVPDWLHEASDEASSSQPEVDDELEELESSQESAGIQDESPDQPGKQEEVEMPSWLANLQDSADDGESAESSSVFVDVPGASPSDEEEIFTLQPDDLPDWLNEVSPSDYAIEEESVVEETPIEEASVRSDEANIAPAELPSWLQAMRPVEELPTSEAIHESRPDEVERVGPLAGLNGVLPAEPGVVHFGSPSTTVQDFDISQTQKGYAELLQSMITSEEDTPPIKRHSVALPQQILRWAIAIILYAVVLLPIIFGSQFVMLPNAQDILPENLAVASLVNELQENESVLIAFEYQPGLSGEMTAAGAAVIDHLLNKGAIPVIISTQPTGPGLAEDFFAATQSHHSLISNGEYVNLGYISGNTAALLNFATDPRTAIPLQLSGGGSRWDQPPLANIHSIRDFAMVFVLTDDSDTARGWIEQVQPLLVDPNNPEVKTFFALVVSAQAEPLVYPYYMTSPKQVDGLISGVTGGAYYENTINKSIFARDYWDSYSIGLSIMLLVLMVSGLIKLGRLFLNYMKVTGQRGKR